MCSRDLVAALIERFGDLVDSLFVHICAAVQNSLAGDGVAVLGLIRIGSGRDHLAGEVRSVRLDRREDVVVDVDVSQLHGSGHFNDGGCRDCKHVAGCVNMAVLHLGRCVAEAVALGLDVLCWIKACRAEDLLGKSQGSGACGSDRDLHALQVGNVLCAGLCVGNDLIDLVVDDTDRLDVGGGCGECAGSFEAVGGNVVHGDAQVHFARLHQVDVLDRCAGGLSRDGDTVSSQLVVDGVGHGAAQREVGSAGGAGTHDEVTACRRGCCRCGRGCCGLSCCSCSCCRRSSCGRCGFGTAAGCERASHCNCENDR